jgi:organic radical activating enzyme
MEKLKISEIFYSAQGEGRFVGAPSVFLRTFGCNFKCAGFGLPRGQKTTEPDDIAKTVHLYNKFEQLPLAKFGCDSYASWHPGFKHLSPSYTVEQAVDAMTNLLPNRRWLQPHGGDVHLVITGGEPLLGWQQLYPDLLGESRMRELQNLTFETNGTQWVGSELARWIHREWHHDGTVSLGRGHQAITFSVSPKLSASGEQWSDAIKPDVVNDYQDYGHVYLKFVVATLEDFEEVNQAVREYRSSGFEGDVYVMPVGGTDTAYFENNRRVADVALEYGYRYSPRLHVDIWSNGWGK